MLQAVALVVLDRVLQLSVELVVLAAAEMVETPVGNQLMVMDNMDWQILVVEEVVTDLLTVGQEKLGVVDLVSSLLLTQPDKYLKT
tara:strand:- start:10 stop:267 length:258 start_codon:yes stop_codon:yes gene_type:complete